jgi:signal transduction histidine kinase/ligand-binding sensor domain-containing protein
LIIFNIQALLPKKLKPPKLKICLLILILLAVLAAKGQTASALNNEYLETVWTTEQGLPQNSVNAIIQSRDGYLWLATFGGLARFDGIKFTTYNSGNTPGLKSNRLLSLFEDRDGTLWIGTQSGNVMTFKDGIGKTYTTADGLPSGLIWAINQDADGTIWIGGQNGAARFVNERFQNFTAADGLPDPQIWTISTDTDGQLLFAVGGVFVRFNGEKFVAAAESSTNLDGHLWTTTSRKKSGGWWIGAGKKMANFVGNSLQSVQLNGVPAGDLRTVFEDKSQTLWASFTTPFGLYRIKDNNYTPFSISLKNDLRSMMEDSEGNLWIGSDGGGLLRLKKKKLLTLTVEDGLPSDSIQTITDDGGNGVWIATAEGLAHWEDGKIKTYTVRDGLPANYVTALNRDRDGSLWIGSKFGLARFKDGKFSKFSITEGDSSPTISVIFPDREANLWVGTHEHLSLLRDGKLTLFRKKEGLVNNDVRTIKQSSDGTLWLGTIGGLSLFKNGSFTNYTAAEGLSNEFIRDIFFDDDGGAWLATYGGGLNYLKNGRIVAVKAKDGLFDEFVSRILPDQRGNFWLLGNRGISRVSRTELKQFVAGEIETMNADSYGVADGMKSSEGNGVMQPAGWRTADGRLWFPTIKGVVAVNPGEINNLPPRVHIEQVVIERNAAAPNAPVIINPGQENIEITYTGLSLTRPEQVKFQYKLEGLNEDWINAGTRRTAYYSYIPPGEYFFKVKANNDGIWSEPATIKIVVYPPFWRTWWFLLLSAFVVALVIYGLFRLRILQLQRQNAAQKEFSRRLINAHETERRRIAAELHDSIGQSLATIKNSAIFAVQSVKNLDEAKEQFDEITEESGNAISEVREIAYNLRPHLLDRLGLTKAISSMLNRTADNLQMKMFLQIDDIDDLFENEAELSIFRIIQESLNNILKHAEATEIRVTIERREDLVNIKIEDNGKGFDTNSQNQSGFGLLGIAERVRMLGGTFSIKSKIDSGTVTEIEIWTKQLKS